MIKILTDFERLTLLTFIKRTEVGLIYKSELPNYFPTPQRSVLVLKPKILELL